MPKKSAPEKYELVDLSNEVPYYLVLDHMNETAYTYDKKQQDQALRAAAYIERQTKVGTHVELLKKEEVDV